MLAVSGRLGDTLYHIQTHFKATLFIIVCLSAGALAGLNLRNFDGYAPAVDLAAMDIPSLGTLYQTPEENTLAMIRDCQAFVAAQIENPARPLRSDNDSALLHLAGNRQPDTSKDWDRCARIFGTNYWKTDISVKGENGGIALCRAYRAQAVHQSPRVETWCNTVFRDE